MSPLPFFFVCSSFVPLLLPHNLRWKSILRFGLTNFITFDTFGCLIVEFFTFKFENFDIFDQFEDTSSYPTTHTHIHPCMLTRCERRTNYYVSYLVNFLKLWILIELMIDWSIRLKHKHNLNERYTLKFYSIFNLINLQLFEFN